MFRIDTSTAVGALPAPAELGTPGFFNQAPPGSGQVPTVVSADWLNALQEEVMAVIEAAGIDPDKTNRAQLLAAIQTFITTGTSGNFQALQQVSFKGKATAAGVTGALNNYNPAGWSTAAVLALGTTAATQLNGLSGGSDGRLALLVNTGTFPIVITNNNASSTAANRFTLAGASFTLAPGGAVLAEYDAAASRWRLFVSGREVLRANRTYNVATTGNDANDGLSLATAFLTVQQAINAALALDFNGFTVTIQIADGSYAGQVRVSGPAVGQQSPGQLLIQGNTATPANVVFNYAGTGATYCAWAGYSGMFQIQGITFSNAAGLLASLGATTGGRILQQNCVFGAANYQIYAHSGGEVEVVGSCGVSAGAIGHLSAEAGGIVRYSGAAATVTLTGTPAFTAGFARAYRGGIVEVAVAPTFSGAATGPRYVAGANGVIDTLGAGASFFPGSTAGSTATGGQYI